jgi:hypothetical protein
VCIAFISWNSGNRCRWQRGAHRDAVGDKTGSLPMITVHDYVYCWMQAVLAKKSYPVPTVTGLSITANVQVLWSSNDRRLPASPSNSLNGLGGGEHWMVLG